MPVPALGGQRGFDEMGLALDAELAENAQGGVLEHCGHWIPEERLDYLTEQLGAFSGEPYLETL